MSRPRTSNVQSGTTRGPPGFAPGPPAAKISVLYLTTVIAYSNQIIYTYLIYIDTIFNFSLILLLLIFEHYVAERALEIMNNILDTKYKMKINKNKTETNVVS